jgi:hypothetical protein
MEHQKRTRSRDERPYIGDHSEAQNAWRLDPSDVARHAQLRRRNEQRGPLGKVVRYSALVVALGGAFAVYWNFDALRQVSVEAPALSGLFKRLSPDDANAPSSRSSDGNAVVESSHIVGTAAPTSMSTARETQRAVEVAKAEQRAEPTPKSREAPAAQSSPAAQNASGAESAASAPTTTTSTDSGAPSRAESSGAAAATLSAAAAAESSAVAATGSPAAAAVASAAAAPAAAPASTPAPVSPPSPETIAFALPKVTVSESDASAAVLVVRSGGTRGPSVFTWWTTEGTAKAGKDYVDLGRVVVKFAAGEQNRAIHIPIVGDGVAEDTESFYVNLAPGDDASAEPQDRVEVVIEDDDAR